MTDSKPKRLSTWKLFGLLSAVFIVILLIGIVWVRSVTASRWARLTAELQVQAQKERDRAPHRPVLRGTAVPGNAWDDYRAAMTEMQKIPGANKLGELVLRSPKADPAVGVAALEQGGRVLDLLAKGAAKETSRYGYDWERGFKMGTPRWSDMSYTVTLAALKARALAEEGRKREAGALLLDAAQFGRDATDDGPLIMGMVGMAMLMQSLDGLRELTPIADAETLADLDSGLAALDRNFPSFGACLRREHLGMAWSLVSGDPELPGEGWGFLRQLVFLKAYDANSGFLERSAQAAERSWSESLATAKDIKTEVEKSWNPIVKVVAPGLASPEKMFRERRAQLRLLRAAVHYRRTGEVLDLDDPFGAKLHSSTTADGVKLWSVGGDGYDDGGHGEWKTGPDLVLETKR